MESATVADRARALWYLPLPELERIRGLDADATQRAAAFADACRLNVLYMVARAGSGHLGTSFSALDVLSWLQLEVLGPEDVYFSSKGHDAPALYAVLIGLGRLDFDLIHRLRRLGGLPGHPDVRATPEVNVSTGSLGMGISKAKGIVAAARLAGRSRRVFVLTGDGELQEGQFWESLAGAANRGYGEITAIVDHNKLQSDTWVSEVSDLGDVVTKARGFGWEAASCDGHDIDELAAALERLERTAAGERPKLLVANTIKGAGVSFMEPGDLERSGRALYPFHSGAPSDEQYELALGELRERLTRRLEGLGQPGPRLERSEPTGRPATPARPPQRLVAAYGDALAAVGEEAPGLVALDADLYLDTGLIAFRERFPERFFECGIAEQDMVSQAGAMALAGLTPAVHSFACFLSTRPNEQIYNNATEGTKVIYVGSLAGLVPGGPGHSHQSVRDISALGAMPGMALLEPASEHEAALATRWAVLEAPGPVYIRLVSVPWELPFDPPRAERLEPGRGSVVRRGGDGLVIAAGPVMASQAWLAAERLAGDGTELGVAVIPWLRAIDGAWLAELAGDAPIACLDNHYVDGGQGDAVLRALAAAGAGNRLLKLGVESVPVCGSNDEVLRAHGLDAESVARRIEAELLVHA
jgi:transketolase